MARRPAVPERTVAIELFQQAGQRLAHGKLDLALRLAGRSRELFISIGDFDGACASASLEGRVHVRAGHLDPAQERFAWARAEAERRGLVARQLAAMTELGTVCEMRGDLPGAVAVHREVLERQRARGDDLGIAVAAGNVGRLLPRLAPGRSADAGTGALQDDARTLLTEAMERFELAGNEPGVANALICLGDLERSCGNLAAAESAFARVARATEGVRMDALQAVALLNLGYVRRDLGQLQEALAAFADSLRLATGVSDRQGAARARLAVAMARADVDPLPDAAAAFAELEADFTALGQPSGALMAAVNRAALLCRMGRLHDGRGVLRQARSALRDQGDRLGAIEVAMALAEVALTLGDGPEAEAELLQAPADQCPGRLGLRRGLLEVRLLLRRLKLTEAQARLEALPKATLSAAEKFGLTLALCEIGTLRGDAEVPARLAALEAQALASQTAREVAAATSARGQDAFWRGDLDAAVRLGADALARWQVLGEPLPLAQAHVHLARTHALRGESVAPLQPVLATLQQAGARDAVLVAQVLLDALAGRAAAFGARPAAGDTGANTTEGRAARVGIGAGIAALRAGGHDAAALVALLHAATVLGDADLRRHAADRLADSECAPPGWWPR